ncbi:MAG: hypothetical protein JWO53_659, partial [Chlamydiia bacterium]|nr:hypothetical protein [Chlamydiia bacterium]
DFKEVISEITQKVKENKGNSSLRRTVSPSDFLRWNEATKKEREVVSKLPEMQLKAVKAEKELLIQKKLHQPLGWISVKWSSHFGELAKLSKQEKALESQIVHSKERELLREVPRKIIEKPTIQAPITSPTVKKSIPETVFTPKMTLDDIKGSFKESRFVQNKVAAFENTQKNALTLPDEDAIPVLEELLKNVEEFGAQILSDLKSHPEKPQAWQVAQKTASNQIATLTITLKQNIRA